MTENEIEVVLHYGNHKHPDLAIADCKAMVTKTMIVVIDGKVRGDSKYRLCFPYKFRKGNGARITKSFSNSSWKLSPQSLQAIAL